MKKLCKYIIWILIFLGISAVVAMLTVNNQNSQANQRTNTMEAQMINGQNALTFTPILFRFNKTYIYIE